MLYLPSGLTFLFLLAADEISYDASKDAGRKVCKKIGTAAPVFFFFTIEFITCKEAR